MEDEPETDEAWVYEIKIQGRLSQSWSGWFDNLTLTYEDEKTGGPAVITLTGPVVDQAALRGLLKKIWDLNLAVISVKRIEREPVSLAERTKQNSLHSGGIV